MYHDTLEANLSFLYKSKKRQVSLPFVPLQQLLELVNRSALRIHDLLERRIILRCLLAQRSEPLGKISNLHWVDNGEVLEFKQDGSELTMNCTGYEYGVNLVVRVAEADLEG